MKIKILSLGINLEHDLFVNSNFVEAPSFADFDVVIIEPQGLSQIWTTKALKTQAGNYFTDTSRDGGYGKHVFQLFEMRKRQIVKLLTSTQGLLICYLRNLERSLHIKFSGRTEQLNIYSWLPIYHYLLDEPPGETRYITFPGGITFRKDIGQEVFLSQKHSFFSPYFYAFRKQIKYECIIEPSKDIRKFINIIFENKVKDILSCEFQINGGKIIFIPPNLSKDSKKQAGVLLDCIKGSFELELESPAPEWISAYFLPDENKNTEKIVALNEKISELQQKKENLENEQNYIAKFKGLLYEKGKRTLEPLVREAFKLIGFKVLKPEVYEEEYDLYIKEKGLTIIGEVEGTDNSQINKDKYTQLLDYVETEIDKRVDCKGIRIGNAFRNQDPASRAGQFSKHAIIGCERQKYCRITTIHLFEIVKELVSGNK